MRDSLSAVQARRLALAAQGLGARPAGAPGGRALASAIRRMGVLQIDSVNVFARSHYMPLFSRLGPYDTAALDRLLFDRRPRFTESWAHVASFVPREDWGLFAFRREELRAKYGTDPDSWFRTHGAIVDWVRAELAARGPLRPAQIEHDAKQGARGPWWDWDVVKRALELLWLFGEVAIAGRRGFERRYALTAQVIPEADRQREWSRDDAIHELVGRAARAYGVATAADIADYWRLRNRGEVLHAIGRLVDEGMLHPVRVEGWTRGGRPLQAWRHREVAVPRRSDAAAVLSPFDPVVWFRDRATRVFDFDYRIEIYTPAAKRQYGYYSLPVVVGDQIVGRVDLKAERSSRILRVQSAWWEHGAPTHAAEHLATLLRDAAAWQGLESITVSDWGNAADDIAATLGAPRHTRAGVGA